MTLDRMETSAELTVVVRLKPHDVYTPFQWDRNNLARWVVAIVLCWIFYDIYKSGLDPLRSFPDSGSIIAVLVVLVVFILLALLLFPYLRVRALFGKSPLFHKAVRYTFSAQGVRFESDDANGALKWSAFDRIVETRKVFVLSTTSQAGTYIPKRCLTSQTDIACSENSFATISRANGHCDATEPSSSLRE